MERPRIETGSLLDMLGYSYYFFDQMEEAPEFADKSFEEIIPELLKGSTKKTMELVGKKLYKHQLESLQALREGSNIILKSGTGSGKTEAWFLYTVERKIKTLSIYPTLALAYDQLNRLSQYCLDLNMKIMILDAARKQELISKQGLRNVKRIISESDLVVTNPAFLLNEVKKTALKGNGLLSPFFQKMGLIVIDDFDFYGPREIALLFSILKTLVKITGVNTQFAFMTAMLANPEEVAEYLTEINGRDTKIISGRAFKAKNRVYIVLGKNLRKLWEEARKFKDKLEQIGVGRDILDSLGDFQLFQQNVYRVWDALRYAGIPAPEPWSDPVEILSNYVYDEAVTLVFTRSIERAEELSRRVIERTGRRERVASHHHLISREMRREIEDAVRSGLVKVLVSPRTLSQGIDIGEVLRVVHVGLPDSLREFYQREGRKGRRAETKSTETVIIPQGSWDYDLLSRGVKTVEKWLNMSLEKVIVNPKNNYSTLFESLLKFQSPILRRDLTNEEIDFLKNLGLFNGLELSKAGKRVWRQMNFYEYAPPYGIKRLKIEEDGSTIRLEDVSHCDLVEKFQPGSIDYTSDSVVTLHRLGGGRTVTSVIVEPLRERTLRRYEGTAYALEEYERVKESWGEEPNIWRDYVQGRLHSRVFCVVHPPIEGFGKYVKIPNRVEWIIIGEKKKMTRKGDETLFYRDKRSIVVAAPTYGKYEDYTYGVVIEVGLEEDPELLRLGLAYVMIVLRRVFGIPLETIMYSVTRLGERKFIALHEPESAGLLEKIDWGGVYRSVQAYTPDEIDEILLEALDEYSYSAFISLKLDWRIAREYALRALDYIRRRERIILEFMDKLLEVPKPSRSLKIASIQSLYLPLREDFNSGIYVLSVYDGEENVSCSGITEFSKPDHSYLKIQEAVSRLIDEGFKIVTYNIRVLYDYLDSAGLKSLKTFIKGLESTNSLIDSREVLCKSLGYTIELEDVKKILGISSPSLSEIMRAMEDAKRMIPKLDLIEYISKIRSTQLIEFVEGESRVAYLSYIIGQKKLEETR
ncbi:MAG: DEAD/DEAH box helicase [Thaumarchaeota archaeon]|jgi:DEAD/DEAH box helicase domain-containing protein|nr:DEAD/DEAH box helicase [Candidatus Geocrenenecus arthurdayi]